MIRTNRPLDPASSPPNEKSPPRDIEDEKSADDAIAPPHRASFPAHHPRGMRNEIKEK
jgi:hypothetical protein